MLFFPPNPFFITFVVLGILKGAEGSKSSEMSLFGKNVQLLFDKVLQESVNTLSACLILTNLHLWRNSISYLKNSARLDHFAVGGTGSRYSLLHFDLQDKMKLAPPTLTFHYV